MVKKKGLISGIAVFLLILLSISCENDRNHPGYDYFPDMFYSEAYETYSENPVFEDGKTLREPVEGTISREFIPFQFTNEEGERERAGEELTNPYAGDESVLERGRDVYESFCTDCHGDEGKGQGFLYTSGMYAVLPRSLVGEVARNLKDGEIYHSITLGFGSMGPHKSLVRPDDRWKAISYIRQVLQENALEDNTNSE